MSKSIYEEALEILVKQANERKLSNDIVVNRWSLERIEKVINQAQKQEKLLELYRQLVKDLGLVIEHDTTDTWDGPEDYEYLEINYDSIKSLNTYKQIKELEK